MALPTSQAELLTHCKRALGDGAVEVNITANQETLAIDEALAFFKEYHSDFFVKRIVAHQITSTDKTNEYIEIGDTYTNVTRVLGFPGTNNAASPFFNVRYQTALSDFFGMTSGNMTNFYLSQRQINLINEMISPDWHVVFSRYSDRLYITTEWNNISEGDYIIYEAYELIDETTYTEVYSNLWLIRYTTAIMKRIWGSNLKKYEGITMPGGITFSGQQMYDEANEEVLRLEEEIKLSFQEPAMFIVG